MALLALTPQIGDFLFGLRASTDTCRTVQVVDGDTVDFRCRDRGLVRARLTGFDTPELFSPTCATEAAAAYAATWHLRVTLARADRLEVALGRDDRWGRPLAEVRVDGRPLADLMIEAGHARSYAGGRRKGWCT